MFRRFAVLFMVMVALVSQASGQDASSSSIEKASRFIGSRSSGEYVLGFVHFGATYKRHKYLGNLPVKDRFGKAIPGEFAAVYEYDWDANGPGNTHVAFLCDKNGKVEDVRVLKTNAVLHQPFVAANATIQLLGAVIVEAFKDQFTAEDKRLLEKLLQNADSEGLLEFGLTFRQAAGIR